MGYPTIDRGSRRPAGIATLLLAAFTAHSADSADTTPPALDTITVVATGVSNMTAASAGDVSQAQIGSEPLLRPAAILENIPGLIVTQHSGEGKANQYLVRGYNLDHGTDIANFVDDMPVNRPTNTHGQGYSDVNFIVPDMASGLDYTKGPYYASVGDFGGVASTHMKLTNDLPYQVCRD